MTAAARTRRRLRTAVALAAVPVVLVGLLVWMVSGSDASSRSPDGATSTSAPAGPTSAPTPSGPTSTGAQSADPDPVTPQPTGSPVDANELPPLLPVVALDEIASVDQVAVSMESIEAIDGQGVGPGNVAGPALRVTLRIENRGSSDVTVDDVSVNLFHGPELTPASPLDDPSRSPFRGTLAPGDTAEGSYVFSVPTGARDQVTVEVGYRAGASRAQFSGSAA